MTRKTSLLAAKVICNKHKGGFRTRRVKHLSRAWVLDGGHRADLVTLILKFDIFLL